jgi:hypothetical protein
MSKYSPHTIDEMLFIIGGVGVTSLVCAGVLYGVEFLITFF